tara:strand:- start:442 stop:1569 length:1128 start_codon:yes stop_codon:yes gene_type:complete
MKSNKISKTVVFLCGASDFHAMDWYRTALKIIPDRNVVILTDLIAGEGFKKLINEEDKVYRLLIIDKLLFSAQSKIANIWRNIIKLLIFPYQVYLLRTFSKRFSNSIYFAHSMYYMVLAWAGRVEYVGTPQGSDILIKPYKSKLYKYFTIKALLGAKAVTVDSLNMSNKMETLCNIQPQIIQNGIDIKSILKIVKVPKQNQKVHRSGILSIRGITPIYRIEKIIKGRNTSKDNKITPLTFTAPFAENDYKNVIIEELETYDQFLGRLDKVSLHKRLSKTKLVISIPFSDSSPKSVYESIFLGCAVAITFNKYYDLLPECMQSRIVLINLEDDNWFGKAIHTANEIVESPYVPSEKALHLFDQRESFKAIVELLDK